MELQNKIVLVTGGVVRVGKTIALEFLQRGANVYCHYHRSEEQATHLKKIYPQIELLQGDLSEVIQAEEVIDQVVTKSSRAFEPIDFGS